jgi:hypothetical protein
VKLLRSTGMKSKGEYADQDSDIFAPPTHWEASDKCKPLLGEMAVVALASLSSKEQWYARERRISVMFLHTTH